MNPGQWELFDFEASIFHGRYLITLEVDARFYKGTTPGMGDDPDELEIICARDSMDNDVWPKLSTSQQHLVIEEALNKAEHL